MQGTEHVGDDAELYALGSLNDIDRVRVERHVRTCADCAHRVGSAEETVVRLIDETAVEQPASAPRPLFARRPSGWISAVAAAIVVMGLLTWSVTSLHDRAGMQADRAAVRADQAARRAVLTAMLQGHFLHAPFLARVAGSPAAKLIYAREGGWLYIIVGPGRGLEVAVVRQHSRKSVGAIAASDATRALFISPMGRVDSVELFDGGIAIACATPAYPKS